MTTHPYDVCVISAVYNVARYLPEYTASLDAQKGVDLARVQVVVVDDGSTDDSLTLLQAWAARSPLAVTVLTKENGGQGSARNLGLTAADATWVTFTDPDDTLDEHYFHNVLGFVGRHPDAQMVATSFWMHWEEDGSITDTHPRRALFQKDQLVDLDLSPNHFHGAAPAAFFLLDRIRELDLFFDTEIRPNFEDGHFCGVYLLGCPNRLVAFVGSARYFYRKRSDNTSTLNRSLAHVGRYTVVPRRGYLDLLQRSTDANGHAATWVQFLIMYELSWFFSAEAAAAGSETAAKGEVAEEFLAILREIVELLDPSTISDFAIRRFDSVWRDFLLHGVRGDTWHTPFAVVGPVDRGLELVRVIHRFTGPEPAVEYVVDGLRVVPEHSKVRSHVYFDHTLVHERISWFPVGDDLQVRIDGEFVETVRKWPRPKPLRTQLGEREPRRMPRWVRRLQHPVRSTRNFRRRTGRKAATSWLVGRRYREAWVLLDRLHDADDSGEHLFHHLRANRPDINAWFVLEKGTPDWERLHPQLGRRLVAYGSLRWVVLMLNAVHVISSHVDRPVHRPERIVRLLPGRRPTWRFSFLQHGVIKDDLSNWLNPKALHLFVTSTPGEQASIVSDGSPYAYTTKEAVMTGLPRFDRLLEAASRVERRDLVLVAPTWRQWLTPPLTEDSQRRRLREDFHETEYAQNWFGFLRDERLAELCRRHDLTVGFLPHPNLQQLVKEAPLPAHVTPLGFVGNDVQALFARAAVLVTDYSSMAFNAAYLDRPVVYFQFDAEAVQSGAHVGRAGYFEYERDGFGPVVGDLEGALQAVEGIAAAGFVPAPTYLDRNAATFVLRDGKCCERVTASIEHLRHRYRT